MQEWNHFIFLIKEINYSYHILLLSFTVLVCCDRCWKVSFRHYSTPSSWTTTDVQCLRRESRKSCWRWRPSSTIWKTTSPAKCPRSSTPSSSARSTWSIKILKSTPNTELTFFSYYRLAIRFRKSGSLAGRPQFQSRGWRRLVLSESVAYRIVNFKELITSVKSNTQINYCRIWRR